jgi:PKD repeat protein
MNHKNISKFLFVCFISLTSTLLYCTKDNNNASTSPTSSDYFQIAVSSGTTTQDSTSVRDTAYINDNVIFRVLDKNNKKDSVYSCRWDFGDGTPIQSGVGLTNGTHRYITTGIYLVKVSVQMLNGGVINTSGLYMVVLNRSNPTNYPSTKLPDKFIGVYLGVDPIAGPGQLNYVKRMVDSATIYGIKVICLVVNWSHVQPTKSGCDFISLNDMVTAIKSKGCQCILRTLANAENFFQAWPTWLIPVETYNSGTIINPLPWDSIYRTSFYSFVNKLADTTRSRNLSYPDAIQISVGGSFGEQVLAGYTPPPTESYATFLNKLFTVEEEHITKHLNAWGTTISDYIVMVNSLDPTPTGDVQVGNFAISNGVRFIQSNANAYDLQNTAFGQNNINLLKSLSGTCKIILEDTDKSRSVQSRLDILDQLEKANGFIFSGIILIVDDLKSTNAIGIANLRTHLGL